MASFTVALKSWVSGAFAQKANNLSDLDSAATARTNLGLGDSATKATGTTAGTVAAGDDSRITGAASGLVHFVVGYTEPESSTTEDGRPIVWIDTTVTVAATAPTFSDAADTYTIPTTTGVTYQISGTPVPAGTYPADPPTTVTITAIAQPGYALTGTTTWSGDFAANIMTPSEAGTLHLHYDAAATGVLSLSGSDVTAWAPSAGSTGDLVTYAAGRPSTSTIGGVTAVKFIEGESDALRTTSLGTLTAASGITICAVVMVEGGYGAGTALSALGGSLIYNGNGEPAAKNSTYTAASTTPMGVGTPKLLTWELDGTALTITVNGTATTTTAGTPINLSGNFSLGGAYGGTGTDFCTITIGEVWAYNAPITDDVRAGLLAYAQAKWGVA